jgi:hypothetical protein
MSDATLTPPAAIAAYDDDFYAWTQEQARLLRAGDRFDASYARALEAGEGFAAHQGRNPAMLAWRSEAALCAHALTACPMVAAWLGLALAQRTLFEAPELALWRLAPLPPWRPALQALLRGRDTWTVD